MTKVVLITGCSTGIGHALAKHLTQAGYTVIATARNVVTLNDLPCVLKSQLDVTQPESIQKVVAQSVQ